MSTLLTAASKYTRRIKKGCAKCKSNFNFTAINAEIIHPHEKQNMQLQMVNQIQMEEVEVETTTTTKPKDKEEIIKEIVVGEIIITTIEIVIRIEKEIITI